MIGRWFRFTTLRDASGRGDDAHNLLGVLATSCGDVAAAVAHLERSLAVTSAERDPVARAGALNNLAHLLRDGGRIDEAVQRVREAVAILAEVGDQEPRPEVWKLTEW